MFCVQDQKETLGAIGRFMVLMETYKPCLLLVATESICNSGWVAETVQRNSITSEREGVKERKK